MKKLMTFLLLALLAVDTVMAEDVNREQAQQIAVQFAANSQPRLAKTRGYRAPRQAAQPQVAYSLRSEVDQSKNNVYVVNLGNDQGFVVVAGEGTADALVMGYCDHGSFDYQTAPVQLKDLLRSYGSNIDQQRRSQSRASQSPRKAIEDIGSVNVGPLITTRWDQMGPFNYLCPDGCPAGCTAVAVSQVMNYWQWPEKSSGTVDGEDFSGHVYEWDKMPDVVTDSTSYDACMAMARLIADVGKAFHMEYAFDGSKAPLVPEPLINNFGYDNDCDLVITNLGRELMPQIKADLDMERPVLFAGGLVLQGANMRHALVCDGYTSNDYFHFNFGWGGIGDGYYKNAMPADFGMGETCIIYRLRPFDGVLYEQDGIQYGLYKNGTAEIYDFTAGATGKENGALVIPPAVDYQGQHYTVTRIRKLAFYQKGHFSKITLGDNIKVIAPYSFHYTQIDSLVLGDNLKQVPDQAFGFTRIKYLQIGTSIQRIGKRAFYMCPLTEVVSRSGAFEVDDEAFVASTPDCGEWLDCITSLGASAFLNAKFLEAQPVFSRLERIGDKAFASAQFPRDYFKIPATLRHISTTAFTNARTAYGPMSRVEVAADNPYFSGGSAFLYNKTRTSLCLAMPISSPIGGSLLEFPSSLIKLEPGSIMSRAQVSNGYYEVTIPPGIIEMEGAFMNCETLDNLTCLHAVPPEVSDTTFSDKMFTNSPDATLHVPEGTRHLYASAPGWRRFPNIVEDQPYEPLPQDDRQYYMVLNGSGSGHSSVRIPVNQISSMQIADNGEDVVIKRNGMDDYITTVGAVDSMTWAPGLVFDSGEVFNLNRTSLTAEAQKCRVTFDATVIDEEVQLCVRNSVLLPRLRDDVTGGLAIDLSLSNGVHELCGTAKISIPFGANPGERVHAAYFNEESGEWEPVHFVYDDMQETVTIMTDHLSLYTVYSTFNENTSREYLDFSYYPSYFTVFKAVETLTEIMASDDPEVAMVNDFRSDMDMWKTLGLDGGYAMLQSLGFTPQAVDKAVERVGHVATAMSIYDLVAAEIKGDDAAKVSPALNTMIGLTAGKLATAIGTTTMTASMAVASFIGVAIQKLGTKVQQRRHDLFDDAMHKFFSPEGSKCYRSDQDWYNYFYPAFKKGMEKRRLEAYIEQSVRMYCNQFWDDKYTDDYTWACTEVRGIGTYLYPDVALQNQLTEEFVAELLNGELISVFSAIKDKITTEAERNYLEQCNLLCAQMNASLTVRFKDSSRQKGQKSRFSGWKVRFTEIPDSVTDKERWQANLNADINGFIGGIGNISVYALIKHKVPCNITLIDPNDEAVATYDFKIPYGFRKILIDVDLATEGQEIEVPQLDYLKLDYEPASVPSPLTLTTEYNNMTLESGSENNIYMQGHFLENARLQKEVERFFKLHNTIQVDESGKVTIGDDLVAEFAGDKAEGTFSIDVVNPFTECTIDEYVVKFNKGGVGLLLNNLLYGTIKHRIKGTFRVIRNGISGDYTVEFDGNGTFDFDGDYVSRVDNVGVSNTIMGQTINLIGEHNVTSDDITTARVQKSGTVTLKYDKIME